MQQQQLRKQENLAESELTVESIIEKVTPVGKLDILPPLEASIDLEENWPLLTVGLDAFESFIAGEGKASKSTFVASPEDIDADMEAGWGDINDIGIDENTETKDDAPVDNTEGEWDLDLDIDPTELASVQAKARTKKIVPLPREGSHWGALWCVNSDKPSDHVLGGSFDTAMQILNQKYDIINFEPLKSYFMNLSRSATIELQGLPSTGTLTTYLQRNWRKSGEEHGLPHNYIHISTLADTLQLGYKLFTSGKFQESLDAFRNILQSSCLACVQTKQENDEILELKAISADYVSALLIELYRKEQLEKGFSPLIAELAAYFSHANLQPAHQQLTLRSAMNIFYKLKNYAGAYGFARRLLALAPRQDVSIKTKQVMALCEQNGLKDEVKLDYDERNPFTVCSYSYKPIYKGKPYIVCKYCKSTYMPDFNGKVCRVCVLGRLSPRK